MPWPHTHAIPQPHTQSTTNISRGPVIKKRPWKTPLLQRYRVCAHHFNLPSMVLDGVHVRWCQQCGRFHPISAFEGDRQVVPLAEPLWHHCNSCWVALTVQCLVA